MNHVIPAIIPESLEHLEETLGLVHDFAHEAQVDVVDGVFVPFTSWPYHEETIADLVDYAHHFRIEADLMLMEPEAVILDYVRAGVRDIVVHVVESVKDFERIVRLKKDLGFRLGLSMNNDSPLSTITDHIAHADYVQFMGIAHIGSQGQSFDERVLTHIDAFRHAFPTIPVSVDGSVNDTTIPRLRDVGVTRFISGSAIVKAERPSEAYHHLESLANQ